MKKNIIIAFLAGAIIAATADKISTQHDCPKVEITTEEIP